MAIKCDYKIEFKQILIEADITVTDDESGYNGWKLIGVGGALGIGGSGTGELELLNGISEAVFFFRVAYLYQRGNDIVFTEDLSHEAELGVLATRGGFNLGGATLKVTVERP
jgi:hypothetical protein